MLSIRSRNIRKSLFCSVAFITTTVSSYSAEDASPNSSWLSSLNPLNYFYGTSTTSLCVTQEQPVRPKYELSVYILGGDGDQLNDTDPLQTNLLESQSTKRRTVAQKQITEKVFSGPKTEVSVNRATNAAKYLGPFQNEKTENTLFIESMNRAPTGPWEDFVSNIQFLDHLSNPGQGWFIDEPTLKLLSEKLSATNLSSISFGYQSLALSNIQTALPSMKELLRKHNSLEKINLLGLQSYGKKDYPIINNLFKDLPSLVKLTHLDLSGLTVDDEGLEILGAFLLNSPLLTHLSVGGGTSVGLSFLCETLLKLDRLETLNLSLANNDSTEIVLKILSHTNLKNLTINGSGTSLSADSYKSIGSALASNTTLTSFTTSMLDTPEKASEFFDGLGGNKSLNSLYLPVYTYGAQGMGDEGASHLANALSSTLSVSYLNLTGSNIGPKGAQSLGTVLTNRATCTTFKADFSSEVVEIFNPIVISGKICLDTMIS